MIEPGGRERFLYFTLGLAPPAATREWVERDIASTGFLVRRSLVLLTAMVIGFSVSATVMGGSAWTVLGGFIGGLIAAVFQMTVLADYVRKRTLRYYDKKWKRQSIR